MLNGRIEITDHAAERYVKRVDRTLCTDEAKKLLAKLAPTAAPLREKTIMGQEQWRIEHPFPCVLVVKRDRGSGAVPVVVTVFEAFPNEVQDEDAIDDRMVALQAAECRAHKPRRVRDHTRRR